jgi:hypothetical protein
MGTTRNLFRKTGIKNEGESTIVPISRNPNQKSAVLRQIFSSNKSAPANRRKGILYKLCAKVAGGWRHFCTKRLRTLKLFSNIQNQNKKIKNL